MSPPTLSLPPSPVVRRAKVPVILLNLTPGPAIDYASFNKLGDRSKMTGEWLAHCQACSVPEIANVFKRAQIPFFQITGMLENDPLTRQEISEWLDAARVAHRMEHNRLGVMGHYYNGMLDVYSDLTQHCAFFGGHIEIIEVDELSALRRSVSSEEIAARVRKLTTFFDPGKIYLNPDCGFGTFAERNVNNAETATRKLKSISEAAKILRKEFGTARAAHTS